MLWLDRAMHERRVLLGEEPQGVGQLPVGIDGFLLSQETTMLDARLQGLSRRVCKDKKAMTLFQKHGEQRAHLGRRTTEHHRFGRHAEKREQVGAAQWEHDLADRHSVSTLHVFCEPPDFGDLRTPLALFLLHEQVILLSLQRPSWHPR